MGRAEGKEIATQGSRRRKEAMCCEVLKVNEMSCRCEYQDSVERISNGIHTNRGSKTELAKRSRQYQR
jgi:hypothetical protein